jgi:hypothetical protein
MKEKLLVVGSGYGLIEAVRQAQLTQNVVQVITKDPEPNEQELLKEVLLKRKDMENKSLIGTDSWSGNDSRVASWLLGKYKHPQPVGKAKRTARKQQRQARRVTRRHRKH